MRTGEVARRAGVNVQTLRYYERRGLLADPERRASGYREYDPDVVRRVRFIKRAQELGFTLAEIAELLALRAGRPASRPDARLLAAAKIEDIDRRMRHLAAMHSALSALVDACPCDDGAPTCAILEALDDAADRADARAADARDREGRRTALTARRRSTVAP